MCRNKKMRIVLLGLTATLSFAGCSDKLVTDTGSGKQQENTFATASRSPLSRSASASCPRVLRMSAAPWKKIFL